MFIFRVRPPLHTWRGYLIRWVVSDGRESVAVVEPKEGPPYLVPYPNHEPVSFSELAHDMEA